MKILFAAIFISALIAAAVCAVLAAKRRKRELLLRAAVCCCIAACSAAGFAMSSPQAHEAAVSAVHVTVSPFEGTPAPLETAGDMQAQGAYTASAASDKFHLPSCSSASKISEDNRLWFSSREEAVSAGYAPCGRCKP